MGYGCTFQMSDAYPLIVWSLELETLAIAMWVQVSGVGYTV